MQLVLIESYLYRYRPHLFLHFPSSHLSSDVETPWNKHVPPITGIFSDNIFYYPKRVTCFVFFLNAVVIYRHKSVRDHKHFTHKTLAIKNVRLTPQVLHIINNQ